MTIPELVKQFPVGCQVQLTPTAKAQGMSRVFHGDTGKVEGHGQKTDLAGNPFFILLIWLNGFKRRKDCPPSLWERVPGDLPR